MPEWLTSLITRAGLAPSAKTPLRSLRYVVLDTELTSLDRRTNRLLSVGAIAMQGASIRLGEQFYRVVRQEVEIPAESILIHGLRPVDIENGAAPEEVWSDLRAFVGEAVLVGHFFGIDRNVLRKELRPSGGGLENAAIDTARVCHWLESHRARYAGLEQSEERLDLAAVAQRLGLEVHDVHHALYDAYVTAQLWQRFIPQLEAHGVATLRECLRIAGC